MRVIRSRTSTPAGRERRRVARRAEWHCMFTATGFIVMCVAASSTCTANAVESPPSPCGPTPSWFTAAESSSSSAAPSGSAQRLPSGARRGALWRDARTGRTCRRRRRRRSSAGRSCRRRRARSRSTNVLIASTPSAGIAILQERVVLRAAALRDHLDRRARRAVSQKSTWITGTPMPQEVCSFLRVSGCTTDERSGCSRVARSQPRRIACFERDAVDLDAAADRRRCRSARRCPGRAGCRCPRRRAMLAIIVPSIALRGGVGFAAREAVEAPLDVRRQHLERADVELLGRVLDVSRDRLACDSTVSPLRVFTIVRPVLRSRRRSPWRTRSGVLADRRHALHGQPRLTCPGRCQHLATSRCRSWRRRPSACRPAR